MDEHNSHLLDVFSNAPVVVFDWSPTSDPEVSFVTESVRPMLGHEAQTFLTGKRRFTDTILSADRSKFRRELQTLSSDDSEPQPEGNLPQVDHSPLRVTNGSDETVWVRVISTLVSGNSLTYRTFVLDGSRERSSDLARQQSDERFRQIFETNLAVKLLIDPNDGRIVQANQAASEFYGYAVERLQAMKISEINMLSVEEVANEMQRARTEERLFFRFPHRLASGEVRDVEVFSGPVLTAEKKLLYSIVFDVTDRNQAVNSLEESNRRLNKVLSELRDTQAQMVQRERLAAIGQLTAGLAHDFNNIMTGIICTADMMQLAGDLSPTHHADVGRILESGERASKLIRQLLDFSRQSRPEMQTFDLVATCHHTIDFLRRMIPEDIEIELQQSLTSTLVDASSTAIEQVITNLVLNARDAISDAGKISISLARVKVSGVMCNICNREFSGDWIRLDIRDNGCGISKEDLPKILEPFFTTKSAGLGSGLGLAQSAGIIDQHGGHLAVQSECGSGTTISCFMRPSSQTETFNRPPEPTETIVRGRGEQLLLVEDDPAVRRAYQQMIEFLNYRVLVAKDGQDALEVFQSCSDRIPVVISDTVMPIMGGLELQKSLYNIDPDVKLLLMSGYPLGERDNPELQQTGWLKKPVDIATLSRAIHEAMNGAATV